MTQVLYMCQIADTTCGTKSMIPKDNVSQCCSLDLNLEKFIKKKNHFFRRLQGLRFYSFSYSWLSDSLRGYIRYNILQLQLFM